MRPDLFDVLVEAKADAPPPRLGVDEIVAAGKRRQRRRTAGWVIAAATAAVVAIAVPQIITRPVAQQPATPSGPGPSFTFSEFTAGQLRVTNPAEWRPRWQLAAVTNLRGDNWYGLLRVYPPGVDPMSDFDPSAKTLRTYSVHGRTAFFIERDGTPGPFVWDYGGGMAVMDVDEAVTPAEQRDVAEAFAPTAPRPVRLSFKVDHLPVDYRLTRVTGSTRDAGFRIEVASIGPGPVRSITVEVADPPSSTDGFSSTPSCRVRTTERTDCGLRSADGSYSITVSGALGIAQSELFKILTSVQYAEKSTIPVSEALPESALPAR